MMEQEREEQTHSMGGKEDWKNSGRKMSGRCGGASCQKENNIP